MILCILGAGYSSVAGDPLTSQLFHAPAVAASREASQRFERVRKDFDVWLKHNPTRNAEEYLEAVYVGDLGSVPFKWAVELIETTLATSSARPSGAPMRYATRVTRPSSCSSHIDFWHAVLETHERVAVMTPNYDFRVEQVLRHRSMFRHPMPGFYYGGIPQPQILQGTSAFTVTQQYVQLTGTIPLFKIHGSLNWSVEGGLLKLYQDMRPAYRRGGEAAIVPPLPTKNIPKWLVPVWKEAKTAADASTRWIVCGYSLPTYDISVVKMLQTAASKVEKIYLMTPHGEKHRQRWQNIAPNAEIELLQKLPQGISNLRTELGRTN